MANLLGRAAGGGFGEIDNPVPGIHPVCKVESISNGFMVSYRAVRKIERKGPRPADTMKARAMGLAGKSIESVVVYCKTIEEIQAAVKAALKEHDNVKEVFDEYMEPDGGLYSAAP